MKRKRERERLQVFPNRSPPSSVEYKVHIVCSLCGHFPPRSCFIRPCSWTITHDVADPGCCTVTEMFPLSVRPDQTGIFMINIGEKTNKNNPTTNGKIESNLKFAVRGEHFDCVAVPLWIHSSCSLVCLSGCGPICTDSFVYILYIAAKVIQNRWRVDTQLSE